MSNIDWNYFKPFLVMLCIYSILLPNKIVYASTDRAINNDVDTVIREYINKKIPQNAVWCESIPMVGLVRSSQTDGSRKQENIEDYLNFNTHTFYEEYDDKIKLYTIMDIILDKKLKVRKHDTITLERDSPLHPVNSEQQNIAGLLLVKESKSSEWKFSKEVSIEDFDTATIDGNELYTNSKYDEMRVVFMLTSLCDHIELPSRPRFLLNYNESENILFSIRVRTLIILLVIMIAIFMVTKKYRKQHSIK